MVITCFGTSGGPNMDALPRAKAESEAGHFMDYEENKLYYSTGASPSLKLNKNFWRAAISKVLKITSSAHRVVYRAQDPRLTL